MRNSKVLASFILFLFFHTGLSQTKGILSQPFHSNLKTGTVKDFLDEINARSGITIEYASNALQLRQMVELTGKEASLGMLLQKVLKGQLISLLEKNNKLILSPSREPVNPDLLVSHFKLYGFVKEQEGQEPMIDATLRELSTNKTFISNNHGYYNITLPEGKHQLLISYAGFIAKTMDIELHGDTRLDVSLSVVPELKTIVVNAGNLLKKSESDRISREGDNTYNDFVGEYDPLRSTFLLPGVLNVSENFGNMQVRGGGPDENLFLLDGIQVYNPSHLLGALSIVNETILKNMRLYKSDFPARFSGSLSSVLDIYTKDGDMEKWQGVATAGILFGAFTLEGPLVKNKTAVVASIRHSWGAPIWGQSFNNLHSGFYDINGKITQLLSKNDKLMLNFYSGADHVKDTGTYINNLHKWGNLLGSLAWNHLIGSKSFINSSVDISSYNNLGSFEFSLVDDNQNTVETQTVNTLSKISHFNAKIQGEFYFSAKSKLNAGIIYNHTSVQPSDTRVTAGIDDREKDFHSFSPLPFDLFSGYAELEYKLSKHFFIRPGFHASEYQYNKFSNFSFQPRFFMSYQLNEENQLFGAYNKMTQYLHLVTNPYLGLNQDIWVPSTATLAPEESQSLTLGYEFRKKGGLQLSLAGYWKNQQHVTNFASGGNLFLNQSNWEQNIESGKGWSEGLESQVQWSHKKISIQLSYTLSWTWRAFPGINQGQKFPYKYDRRHILGSFLVYHLNKSLDISGQWLFSSGDAVSLPDYIYPNFDQAGQVNNPSDLLSNYRFIYQFTGVNQYRSPNYSRFDLAIRYHNPKAKKWQSSITTGIYNISGSPDQYTYDLLGSVSSKSLLAETKSQAIGFLPYISYTLKF